MKCQRCPKQATFQITEVLPQERFEELHLCEECAKEHLAAPEPLPPKTPPKTKVPQMDDLSDLGNRHCEACGIKFVEFRNTGRLGCPHDYDSFQEELLPLLDNIHGETKHVGKTPHRMPKTPSTQVELTKLRMQLQVAIQKEAYEEAAQLRDKIKQLEEL
jgi:protein arginine kinase activator